MKRIAVTAALAATLLAGAAATFADPTPKATPAAKPAPNLVCPVTNEKIASVKEAVGSSVYKGKTYYFCCAGCKPMFDKNPAKYIKTASATTKSSAAKSTKATPAAPAKS